MSLADYRQALDNICAKSHLTQDDVDIAEAIRILSETFPDDLRTLLRGRVEAILAKYDAQYLS